MHPEPIEIAAVVSVAMKEVVDALGPSFERSTSYRLRTVNMLNPEVPGYVTEGDPWDVAFTNPCYNERIIAMGLAAPGSHVPVARAPLAMAVRGASTDPPKPIARSGAGIASVLHAANRIAFTERGSSGATFRKLMRTLGVEGVFAKRMVGLEGGEPMRALLAGKADLAVLPLTNIAPVPGITVAAICPIAMGVHIDISICLRVGAPGAAAEFAEWLTAPAQVRRIEMLGGYPFDLGRT